MGETKLQEGAPAIITQCLTCRIRKLIALQPRDQETDNITTQRLQNPLTKEYTLNHIRVPIIV